MKARYVIVNMCRDQKELVTAPKRAFASRTKLTNKDLESLKAVSVSSINEELYRYYRVIWKDIFNKCNFSEEEIKKIAIDIEEVQSEDDMATIAFGLLERYNQNSISQKRETENQFEYLDRQDKCEKNAFKLFQQAITNSSKMGLASFVKEGLYYKYFKLLEKFNEKEMDNLYNTLITTRNSDLNEELENLSQIINDEHSKEVSTNGMLNLSNRIMADSLILAYEEALPHLCWAFCKNASTARCEKVRDRQKKLINKYGFINKGYQVLKNGIVNDFVVTACDRYEMEQNEAPIITNRKKITDDIKIAYFGTETIEEANAIQRTMLNNGTLRRAKR